MSFFDPELFERLRIEREVTWGRPVRAHQTCGSTNDLALDAISTDAKTGIVFVAHEQTHGRGRRQNKWTAPPGSCLMMSVLIRTPAPLAQSGTGLGGLSLAVGLALCDLVQPRLDRLVPAPSARIKWPNDVYVNDRKLAGILIESRPDRTGHLGVVIGIGLNHRLTSFPGELAQATSLAHLGVADESTESLLVDVLGAIEHRVIEFFTKGVAHLVPQLRSVDYLRDRKVEVEGQQGIGAGFDDQGRLLVRRREGDVWAVSSGHVRMF